MSKYVFLIDGEGRRVEPVVTIERGRFAGRSGTIHSMTSKSTYVRVSGGYTEPILVSSLSVASQREVLALKAGVTWAWLRETLTPAEADFYIGRTTI